MKVVEVGYIYFISPCSCSEMSSPPSADPAATSPMDIDNDSTSPIPTQYEQQQQQQKRQQENDNASSEIPEGDAAAGDQTLEDLDMDADLMSAQVDLNEVPSEAPGMIGIDGVEIPGFDSAQAEGSSALPVAGIPGIPGVGVRRDKSLKEFLEMMDEFSPIVRDIIYICSIGIK